MRKEMMTDPMPRMKGSTPVYEGSAMPMKNKTKPSKAKIAAKQREIKSSMFKRSKVGRCG